MVARPLTRFAVAGLAACFLALSIGPARAADVAREARLLTLDGKFTEANALVDTAPDKVKNDPVLRKTLADLAKKYLKRKLGEEKRGGLESIKLNLHAAYRLTGDDVVAATGAMKAAAELAALDMEARKPNAARGQASWAVKLGEEVLGGGQDTPEVKAELAQAHRTFAEVAHKIQDQKAIIVSYDRGSTLMLEAAEGREDAAVWISEAARLLLLKSKFIRQVIPLETEKRDDEAADQAAKLALKACESPGAKGKQYSMHLVAIRNAREFGLTGEYGQPFMKKLEPGVEGLDIQIPLADAWNQQKVEDWDLRIERRFEDEDKILQIQINRWPHSGRKYGIAWADLRNLMKVRAEQEPKRVLKEVTGGIALHILGQKPEALEVDEDDGKKKKKKRKPKKRRKPKKGKKDAPEVYHYQTIGKVEGRNMPMRLCEWFWSGGSKEGVTYQLRITDWGRPWGLEDPDMESFLQSMFGEQWPEKPVEDKKKKK